ncbi:MAG: sensor domain-containing diguanylate cyclase [Acidocella sp.]|nr:sensor domain-containing diguanylate cyclase [Acidocella sp.]
MNEILTFQRALPSAGFALKLTGEPFASDTELSRVQTLEGYEILDSAAEKAYDDIARLAAYICGTPISVISFIDHSRQWIKSRFSSGVFAEKMLSLPRNTALCDIALLQPEQLILVPDMLQDPRFAGDSLILGPAKLRFCGAMPLVSPGGAVLGLLSVMDRRSRTLSGDQTSALETLGRQVMELLEMRRTVIGLSMANARLGQQNLTDALTGVPNRRAYDQKLAEEISRTRRTGTALSLLIVDVDMFKQYNDTFGHPAGDTALQSVARVLLSSLRPYDFLARYGGEEFAIILPSTDIADALVVAERVRRLVADSEFPHRKFTVSVGVARLAADGDHKALVQAADNGLYRAKTSGRNKVVVGSSEMRVQ